MTQLEDLLIYLNQVHQIDLTGYKRSTLMRRTQVRMQQIGSGNYQGYFDYLQQQPDEIECLLETIYINYTYFFRDPLLWDYLADQIILQMLASKAPNAPIRVWSAGCASGEETYSLAMLFIEALGVEAFQQRVQIYGTDVDPDAILQARQGHYAAHKIELVPPTLQEQYFERRNDGYCWRKDLFPSIDFHVHNLIQDPPLPHIDLLVCRNLFIYFTEVAQLQALVSFYLSLEENGLLLLGSVENLVTAAERSLFTPMNRQCKIFTKVPGANQSSPLLSRFLP
ncbi:MAG: protein-glutamate O-methyltransferase CheR [Leptolyngbya sp. UWPOB_LEPTO1]|uniref:CheR family methyltransferase n=1 Tax=Leptolyngbya sp. UWPOB_LEPTO1 TaxID=2815653 RepID=UPI001ACD2DA2|nr:protein-glutamate O-methyltransferase CheR [Leptolyngbya sp. UWPOB_LEPTO1]MBN8559278.1 protein-glutamate O-methyltransferase CheR [Leptolyngbya sp. UWPOB_LEPTO1]